MFPVWNAWGHALIRMERYGHARVKFKYVNFYFWRQYFSSVILTALNFELLVHFLVTDINTDLRLVKCCISISFQASSSVVQG